MIMYRYISYAIVTTTMLAMLTLITATNRAEADPITDTASVVENQRAQDHFNSNLATAMAIGGTGGTITGAIIGCVVTIPIGCIPGAVVGAGIGGVVGTVAVGGPTLVYSAIDLVQTLQAPPHTTQWDY